MLIGVNTHTSWPAWVAQKSQVVAALKWLGVTHVRDIWGTGLAILTDFEVLSICTTAAQVEESIAKYAAAAVEGPNEQNSKVTDTALRAAQAEVYAAAKGRVPVLSCSINQLHPYASLGQLACDVASLHVYRDGATTRPAYQTRLQKALTTEAGIVAPGKPVWVTETGWFNAGDATRQVTPAAAITLLAETLADLEAAGVKRVYLYSLWDDPTLTGEQGSYGLFDKDWNPKPIAQAVKALLATKETPVTTTLDEADVAVDEFACTTTSCKKPEHSGCVTAKGKATGPHAPRLRDARAFIKGALSRQAEVDGLNTALVASDEALHESEDQRVVDAKTAATKIADLTGQLAAATQPPVVVPPVIAVPTDVPAGYALHRRYDLSKDEGWTLETGKPSNADGSDRPANVKFGQGPEGKSLLILGNRDTKGGTFFTGDAKAMFAPIPNWHRSRAVVEFDAMLPGMWPAVWKRPLSGEGEIDDWEKFGAWIGKTNEDAGTLHATPYDATHKHISRTFPVLGPGRHVIETENAPAGFTWWVDGNLAGTVTKAQFDAATSNRWASILGTAAKQWYFRATLQAGGADGGLIPADLMQWRFWVHELAVYKPA